MNYNYIHFLEDNLIPFELGKRGFIDISCPYCGDSSKHGEKWYGGIHQYKNYYNCWRCGYKTIDEIVLALTGLIWNDIKNKYRDKHNTKRFTIKKETEHPSEIIIPPEVIPLQPEHINYLKSRGFDPDYLVKEWDIRGTGRYGDFAYRIFIPIYFKKKIVSYLGRDWTNKSPLRYRTCDKSKEVIFHKDIVYGIDKCGTDRAIIVEGCTDVWKLGPGAVSTFGINWNKKQASLIASVFKSTAILYDPEEEAQESARKLASNLSGLGIDSEVITLSGEKDPGDLTMNEAREIMDELK